MSKKTKKIFICSECGYKSVKWLGKCSQCDSWNSFEESSSANITSHKIPLLSLSDISPIAENRLETNIKEFDNVMGGGIVSGSLILVGGEPGIGKSTFLLQLVEKLSSSGTILYNCGEESVYQIKLRSNRLNINQENIYLLDEADLKDIEDSILQLKPLGVVIDSIQTVYRPETQGLPGSLTQIKDGANLFLKLSKKENIFIFLVGHVTKEGNIAGPKALEHIVDVVLYIEGDKQDSFRILRSYKNRFGSTDEIGIFKMTNLGLKEISNPSQHFIQDYNPIHSGTTLSAINEGSRPILVEVQALVSSTHFTFPKRVVNGIDINKVHKLIAILEKILGLILVQNDVYINITGGIQVKEPGIELSILVAIYSAFKKISFNKSILFIGELGLAGEIRGVSGIRLRVNEAIKLGIKTIVIPKKNYQELSSNIKTHNVVSVFSIKEVIELISKS